MNEILPDSYTFGGSEPMSGGALTPEALNDALALLKNAPFPRQRCPHIVHPRAHRIDGVYVCSQCGEPLNIVDGRISAWTEEQLDAIVSGLSAS
jgi:hypothetical protein